MENIPQSPLLPEGTPPPAEEKETSGWNIGVLVLILLVLIVGVRLATWQTGKKAEGPAEEQTASVETTLGGQEASPPLLTITPAVPQGVGEVGLIVSSGSNVILREIYFRNPLKAASGENPWVLVYDGYSQIGPQPREIFRAQLYPLTYDQIKIRVLSIETGASSEIVKEIKVEVPSGASTNLILAL